MKIKTLCLLFTINVVSAQTDKIFKNGFENTNSDVIFLNDTGITRGMEYPGGTNSDCSSATILSPQDCHQGRDADPKTNSSVDGHVGFSFIKLDDNGTPLIDQSVDYATTPWACVQDNVTGLIWEVKTTTSGIHNKDNTYQWGGITAIGIDHSASQGIYYDSWNELVQGSNDDTLCGFNNWRVPTIGELSDLMNFGTNSPAIDTNYFPNTLISMFWSSLPDSGSEDTALIMGFYAGHGISALRSSNNSVRLVRSLNE